MYQREHEACQRSLLTLINWINPKGWWSFPVHSHSKCISDFTLDRLVSGAGNTQIWPTQHKHTPPPLKSCIQRNSRKIHKFYQQNTLLVSEVKCPFGPVKFLFWSSYLTVTVSEAAFSCCSCRWSQFELFKSSPGVAAPGGHQVNLRGEKTGKKQSSDTEIFFLIDAFYVTYWIIWPLLDFSSY